MLSYEFPPLGGGGARVVYGLSKELVRAGHEVDLVTMGFQGLPKHEQVNGVNVYRVPCIRIRKSMCYWPEMLPYVCLAVQLILRLRKQNRYGISHTHFIFPDGLVSYLINKISRLPYIITAHGSDVPGYNPDRFKLIHKLLLPLWKKIIYQAHQIVCPSEWLESLILKQNARPNTSKIPNGIDVDKFKPNEDKQKRILIVTRMFERKGVQYFLKALEGINLDYEIHIIGSGPYLETLQEKAKNLITKVKFWGFLDNNSYALKELYETSEIFVLPSEAENFPIVLLEAMAAGMAIVTTIGTGCTEVVGDAAILIEPRNPIAIREALVKLTSNYDLCKELGQAARRRLENNFSWTVIARQYLDLYKRHANS